MPYDDSHEQQGVERCEGVERRHGPDGQKDVANDVKLPQKLGLKLRGRGQGLDDEERDHSGKHKQYGTQSYVNKRAWQQEAGVTTGNANHRTPASSIAARPTAPQTSREAASRRFRHVLGSG